MKTIVRKILYPYVIIILLLPFTILALYNISMKIYMESTTKEDIKNTIKTIQSLLQIDPVKGESSPKLQATLTDLSAALTASKLNGNTFFFVMDENQTIIYPREIDHISKQLIEEIHYHTFSYDGSIEKVHADGTIYFFSALPLKEFHGVYNLSILFVTNIDSTKSIVKTTNLIFVCIICITSVICMIFALKISRRISEPITNACNYAKQIGDGEFIDVPVKTDTKEIYQFLVSLNQMSQRLKAYDQTQKQFLQNASHELRTPLMSIQGYAEGIETDILPNYKEAASIIKKESIRLTKLVSQLLTLSRIENQTFSIELTDQNISNLLLDCAQRINGLAMKKGILLKMDLLDCATAKIDEGLFSQAIINIISNCIRYAKSEILIHSWEDDTFCYVCISDNGDGFSESDLPHIFDRFYKGEKGNFGLGLAIVKSSIEYMGGVIHTYNKNGAVFEIQFKR